MRKTLLALASLAATAALAAPAPATADTSADADADVQRCVATYTPGSKYGSKYCVDTEGSCTVSEYRTTFFGTAYYCHVRA